MYLLNPKEKRETRTKKERAKTAVTFLRKTPTYHPTTHIHMHKGLKHSASIFHFVLLAAFGCMLTSGTQRSNAICPPNLAGLLTAGFPEAGLMLMSFL